MSNETAAAITPEEPSRRSETAQKSSRLKPKREEYYRASIDRLRIILMAFMSIDLFGFPTKFGRYVQIISCFAPIAFFILSGYLVLRPDKNRSARIVRTIKRTAVTFGVLAVVYFGLSFLYYRQQGIDVMPLLENKRLWFEFLVMNVWPFKIGSAIWYVQSLLYAYIILYFLDKWNLLRFDLPIALLLILLTVFTGELCGVFPWSIAGYSYIPGNFLTRALPYVLLGGYYHRNVEQYSDSHWARYVCGGVIGVVLAVFEILLLGSQGVPGYYGHLIGMPLIAVSLCKPAFLSSSDQVGVERFFYDPRRNINWIYYLCQPVGVFITLTMSEMGNHILEDLGGLVGIFTFAVCFCIALLISAIDKQRNKKKKR